MTLWITAIALFSVSGLMGGLNYITTILTMRTRGLSMMRLPLTQWSLLITAVLGLLAFPVLLAAGILLTFDRVLRQRNGADDQHGEHRKGNDQFKKREAERPGITNCRSQFVDSKKLHALITKLKFHREGLALGS